MRCKLYSHAMLVVLAFAVLAGCKDNKAAALENGEPQTGLMVERIVIETQGGPVGFTVELAQTGPQIQKGLMFREAMARDAGMIFLFADEDERAFYMRNTLIPLDMIFIRKSGVIHSIHENARPLDETSIFSQGPVAAVLEINAGLSRELGLKPGQVVHHRFFGNALAP